jgi:hypothetical protein
MENTITRSFDDLVEACNKNFLQTCERVESEKTTSMTKKITSLLSSTLQWLQSFSLWKDTNHVLLLYPWAKDLTGPQIDAVNLAADWLRAYEKIVAEIHTNHSSQEERKNLKDQIKKTHDMMYKIYKDRFYTGRHL